MKIVIKITKMKYFLIKNNPKKINKKLIFKYKKKILKILNIKINNKIQQIIFISNKI
jgi:hypothetical protein